MSGSNAGYTMFRGSVKSSGYSLHSPDFNSLPIPCVTECYHISTGLYQPTQRNVPEDTNHCEHVSEKFSLARLRMGFKKPFWKFSSFLGRFTLEEMATTLTGNFGNRLSSDATPCSGRRESVFWNPIDGLCLCL
jgi:hypothetical protein